MTKSEKLNRWGRIGTGIWVAILIGLAIWKRDEWNGMELNQIGDFVGGGFGPLAFLWLVLGYYQSKDALDLQAKELQASVEALKLQAAELKNSVDAQNRLAKIAEDEHKANLANIEEQRQRLREEKEAERHRAQPIFTFRSTGYSQKPPAHVVHELAISNAGAESTDVRISSETNDIQLTQEIGHFARGVRANASMRCERRPTVKDRLVRFTYLDRDGNPGTTLFEVSFQQSGADVWNPIFTPRRVGTMHAQENSDTLQAHGIVQGKDR